MIWDFQSIFRLSQPLIFHPSFLAISQIHGQHYFLIEVKYLTQLMSACSSVPFFLAASSHVWKAKLWIWYLSECLLNIIFVYLQGKDLQQNRKEPANREWWLISFGVINILQISQYIFKNYTQVIRALDRVFSNYLCQNIQASLVWKKWKNTMKSFNA